MEKPEKNWTNILFLTLTPLIAFVGTALYAWRNGVVWWEPVLCVALFGMVGIGIGSGYHRYFSHRTYEAHPAVETFLLTVGAMALQNSALQWSRDHRDHHRYTDTDGDPYSVTKGFWWAHIQWVFYKERAGKNFDNVPDLLKNPRVMWQHRWYTWIGFVGGLALPTLIGAAFGRPLGGFLWGGVLRIVLLHHSTFLVNSAAHWFGSRPYDPQSSARDNHLLAFFTHGEGYHNFHHKFPSDFRNGIRWWHWDPNKWFIRTLGALRLTRNLRATPPPLVEKARLAAAVARHETRLAQIPSELAENIRARFEKARAQLEEAMRLWHDAHERAREIKASRPAGAARAALKASLQQKLDDCRARLEAAREEWREALSMLQAAPVLA